MRRALSFLTVLGRAAEPNQRTLSWFPLVGVAVGAVVGGAWWVAGRVWPAAVAAVVAVAVDAAVTGCLHLDGLADAADGLLPAVDRERRLEIMADPRVGAFGAVALVLVLSLRTAALAVTVARPLVVVGLWCGSRTMMAVVARSLPSARADGGTASAFVGDRRSARWSASGVAAVPAWDWPSPSLRSERAAAVRWSWAWRCWRWLPSSGSPGPQARRLHRRRAGCDGCHRRDGRPARSGGEVRNRRHGVPRPLGAAAGLVFDRLVPEPPGVVHPVVLFGAVMTGLERRIHRDARGVGLVHAMAGVSLGLGAGALLRSTAVATSSAVAGRALVATAAEVGYSLQGEDVGRARKLLPSLVGRDPSGLGRDEIARAVVESVAENTVDAIVAPAFWAVGGRGSRRAGLSLGQHPRRNGGPPLPPLRQLRMGERPAGRRGSRGYRPASPRRSWRWYGRGGPGRCGWRCGSRRPRTRRRTRVSPKRPSPRRSV